MLAGFLFGTSGRIIELEGGYLAPVANKTILMEIPPQGVEIVERKGRMGRVCGCSVPGKQGNLHSRLTNGSVEGGRNFYRFRTWRHYISVPWIYYVEPIKLDCRLIKLR